MLVPSMALYEPQAASLSHMGSHMLFNYSSVQSSVLEAARGAAQCYIVSLWFEPVSEEGQDTCRALKSAPAVIMKRKSAQSVQHAPDGPH